MSSTGANAGGISSSDESFISFAFAVFSVIISLIYLPWLIRTARGTYLYYTTPAKRNLELENPLLAIWESLCYIPQVCAHLAMHPGVLVTGAKICAGEKVFFFRCCMPKFLRFIIRPKILVVIVWVFLFSSAMYATLTFDAHGILGISKDASTSDIKKAYRSLSKTYHPDQNSTEQARDMYIQIRRAYKALVDREAYEEEMEKSNEFSVGVALPAFMTSRENDGLVLFGLISLLFLLPFGIYWRFFRETSKLPALIKHVYLDRERVATFCAHFGIPVDPKYKERCDSRKELLAVLQLLGMINPKATVAAVANLPPLPEFVQRCMTPEKYGASLMSLGFDKDGIASLQQYFTEHGPDLVEKFLKEHEVTDVQPMQFLSQDAYEATRYLFQQHTIQVDEALEELQKMYPEARTAQKLLSLHREMYELLSLVYGRSKPLTSHIRQLTEMPERTADLLDGLEPELVKYHQKRMKMYIEQQAGDRMHRRQVKQMQRSMGL